MSMHNNPYLLGCCFICPRMPVNPEAALRCFAGLTDIRGQIVCDQAGMDYYVYSTPELYYLVYTYIFRLRLRWPAAIPMATG